MQPDTMSTVNESDISLAILHIGMMIAAWDADGETLPANLPEANRRIHEIFGVEMWDEPNILEARNKIAAVIEQLKDENEIQ